LQSQGGLPRRQNVVREMRGYALTAPSGGCFMHAFPLGDRAGCDPKQCMRHGTRNAKVKTMDRRTASPQLAQEPLPFVLQLSFGDRNPRSGSRAAELGFVERVATGVSFGVDGREIAIDRGARGWMRSEPNQLRMLAIPVGATAKHLAGEQCLAPKRDQALCVEVSGMKRPQSHGDRRASLGCLHRTGGERVAAGGAVDEVDVVAA